MNPANDPFFKEKHGTGLPVMLVIVLAFFLMIPFAGMYLFADTINPFALTGKPFLAFYAALSGFIYSIAVALRITDYKYLKTASRRACKETGTARMDVGKWLVTATILLGIARLVRGIFLGRPVIFLCLMMLLHAILYMAFFKSRATDY